MNVLVTGGAGFIGSHVVERLAARGARVRVLDNLSTGRRENLRAVGAAVEFVYGDIRDRQTVADGARGMDAIIHLAAVASVQASIDDPIGTHESNFDGTLNLLEAARVHGVGRFVYASSASVYGDTEVLPVSEDVLPRPLSPYAADKLAGEYYLRYYATQHGVRAGVFRFFNIYGPRQDPLSPYSGVISIFVERARGGKPVIIYDDGLQTRDFVYVGDLAAILVESLKRELPADAINIGTGNASSLLDLLQAIEVASGGVVVREFAPARAGDIRHSYADVTRLRTYFGSAPTTPIAEGLRRLWEYVGG